jgi:hypothetical protein
MAAIRQGSHGMWPRLPLVRTHRGSTWVLLSFLRCKRPSPPTVTRACSATGRPTATSSDDQEATPLLNSKHSRAGLSSWDRRADLAWSTFGPHAIGTQRSVTVSSGASWCRSQVGSCGYEAGGRTLIRMSYALSTGVESSSAGWNQRASATIPRSSGWWDRLVRSLRVARSACRRSPWP